jgi:hypothetical protein
MANPRSNSQGLIIIVERNKKKNIKKFCLQQT